MSPYLSFAPIERNKLKKITEHSNLFSSFVTDIQSYISLLSAYIAIFTKIMGKPALIFGTMQYQDFTDSLASSTSDAPGCLLSPSSESIPWTHRFDFRDFRKSGSYSDCRLTTEPLIYLGPGRICQISQNTIIYPKRQTTII